jgi:hypothetical protein
MICPVSITVIISIPTILFAGKKFFFKHWDAVKKFIRWEAVKTFFINIWRPIWHTIKKSFIAFRHMINGSVKKSMKPPGGGSAKKEPIPLGDASKEENPDTKSTFPLREEKEPPPITATAPESDKLSLHKPPDGKGASPSSSQNADEQEPEQGHSVQQHSTREGFWNRLRFPFGNHPNPPPEIV